MFRLRELKKRATKPFAVMFKDVDSLRNYAIYSNLEQDILTSQQRPIVLIAEKENQNLSNFVAPKYQKNWLFFTK
ncbi:MAG: Sua5/YciO/YrdC/YwlC family protein [Aliarcobacter cryaerophilus]|nr:Sua5/YciO/YrdC/YwlC family protein [Aliarcobacter cryaerophilus]